MSEISENLSSKAMNRSTDGYGNRYGTPISAATVPGMIYHYDQRTAVVV